MTIIKTQTDSVQIGENEYPKNSLYFRIEPSQETLSIFLLSGKAVVLSNPVTEYGDGDNGNASFATMADLVTALRAAMFG